MAEYRSHEFCERSMTEEIALQPAPAAAATAGCFWRWFACAAVIVAAWMVYRYHDGEQSYVLIHDCLDDHVPEYLAIARSDVFFGSSHAVFQPLLGGIPRGCMPSETNLYVLPYRFMSAFGAFVFCEIVVRLTALLGMALLLRRHIIPQAPSAIICGIAVAFALLPFYPCVGLSIAGQPLLLYAILNLGQRDLAVHNWLIVGLFPFLSCLVMVGIFLIPFLAAYLVWEGLTRRKATIPLLVAWLLLTAGYAAAEYRTIALLFGTTGFVSHRVEFNFQHQLPLSTAVKEAILNFIDGRFHSEAVQWPVMLTTCALALAAWQLGSRRRTTPLASPEGAGACATTNVSREGVVLLALLACCAAISLFHGLYEWTATGRFLDATGIRLLRAIQLQRLDWFHPLCWTLAFALALRMLSRNSRAGLAVAILCVALQVAMVTRTDYLVNCHQRLTGEQNPRLRLTFAEFYSAPLFAEIRDYIGKPQTQYRVASLGMYPSIPLYNGFQTLDAYTNNYPLEYKHRFRKVIAKELEGDESLEEYFDRWGQRCYLFCHELGKQYLYVKDGPRRRVEHLAIDTRALQRLGGNYLLSAVEIGNSRALGLKLEKVFTRRDSPWQIFLYSLEAAKNPGAQRS